MKMCKQRKLRQALLGYGGYIVSSRERCEMPRCWGCKEDFWNPSRRYDRASKRARAARSSFRFTMRSNFWRVRH